ncbi:MAG: 5'-nucleotidase C-terminal domain-containing protein [Verrucomicrobia bacterium]|nr:5'-nucleotidase C-terminal domain-containing protein [Verrucomicrobiota bacterium]
MNTTKLTILQINDTHGYLETHHELFWHGDKAEYRLAGGYARLLTIFNQVRREQNGAVIALDNGDTFHGTFHAVHSEGEALIEPVNLLGLDAWTVHWDFAYGPDRMRELAAKLNHPLLACNCYVKATGELAYPAFTVIERSGVRVGVIGIAATIIDKTMPEHFSTGLRFTLGNEELPGHIRSLRERERVDLVVVISHLGFPQDVKLAAEVAGIDVLLSGHTHNRMDRPLIVNGATIIQSGCHGSFVGRLDVELDGGQVGAIHHQLIPVDEAIPADADMERLIEAIVSPHRQMLAEVVGQTKTALNRNTFLESTMDNFLLQAIAEAADTRIAFSNGWRYGAPIPPGPVTVNDLWNIVPPNPPVSTVELTGQEMWDMIEDNLEHTLAADPYQQMGGYVKRCLGLTLYVKFENPAGSRIQQCFIGSEELKRAETYTAAFVTTQGVPKKHGRNRRDLELHAIDALKRYCAAHPCVNADLLGTVIAV